MSRFKTNIVIVIIFTLTLSACVSKQKYLKSETDLKACTEREINTNEQKVSLNKRIEFQKKQIRSLEEDTTAFASRIREYEQIIREYNQIISSNLSEQEKLMQLNTLKKKYGDLK
ncbi:MAG: hypothetical protein NTZ33_12205 [Bacteroidetes bacterium]|nr:hypothetical protein [Bacteroidota bacterium]